MDTRHMREGRPVRRSAAALCVATTQLAVLYAGNSLPIIGIGLLSGVTSSLTADVTFALIIAACATLALLIGGKRLSR